MIKRSVKIYSAIGVTAACIFLVFGLKVAGVFGLFDEALIDKLFIKEKVSNEIVIVAIDDQSIQFFGEWPWSRERHAAMIEKLFSSGARAVGYDVTFSEQGEGDEALLQSVAKYDKLVFPMEGNLTLNKGDAPGFTSALWPMAQIRASAFIGHANFVVDKDGKVRRAPHFVDYENTAIPPFYLGVLQKGGYWRETNDIFPEFLDFDAYRLFRIKFFGPAETFQRFSFADVAREDFDVSIFQNKIVLVGSTAPDLHDEYFTAASGSRAMPGVEIQANLIESYIAGQPLNQVTNSWWYFLLFIVLGGAAGYGAFQLRWYWSLATFGALMLASIIGGIILFVNGYVTTILYSAGLVVLINAVGFFARYLLESAEKKKWRQTFSQYVSRDVVDAIAAHPEALNLGGEKKKVTIMFSDIRGFTALSEKTTPEGLVRYLNDYFNVMTDIIIENHGLVDKFLGDGIMALWGTPFENDNQTADAVRASLTMQAALREFNRVKAEQGLPEIKIGIGLNFGEAIVGNVGSAQRFDYTAVGDNVNLAARVESLTKFYGVNILVTAALYETVKDKFVFRFVDKVAVKGKEKGVELYELLGELADKKKYAELIEQFDKALMFYRKQDWVKANELLMELQKAYSDDRPIQIYVERAAAFLKNPPMEFDGVFRPDFK